MTRFLCSRNLQQFVRLQMNSSCDSMGLSQSRLGSGWRWISTSSCSFAPGKTSPGGASPGQDDTDPLQDQSMGLAQRFKRTFKQYGKVMIPVHLLNSCMWFGGFYYAAMKWASLNISLCPHCTLLLPSLFTLLLLSPLEESILCRSWSTSVFLRRSLNCWRILRVAMRWPPTPCTRSDLSSVALQHSLIPGSLYTWLWHGKLLKNF